MTKPGTFCCAVEENEVQKEKLCGFAANLETQEKREKKGGPAEFQALRRLPKAHGQMVMSPRGCFVS